jgi:pyruvate ferredoxin oxidoreductase gamma subunit
MVNNGGHQVKEVRIHGRGGQGSVTAAELLAVAAFEDGKYSQAFPFFGVERRGAPVTAFMRLSDNKIRLRSQVYEPDYVIVQDATLVSAVDVTAGLKPAGIVIVNSEKSAEQVGLDSGIDVRTIDATGIALEVIGRPIVNTTLLGAFAGATGEISIDSIKQSVLARFLGKIGKVNAQAAERAYDLTTNTQRKQHKKTRTQAKSEAREKPEKLPTGAIGRPGSSEVTKTGDWRVFFPEFDMEQCTRCGKCLENCPDAAIRQRVLSGPDAEKARKKAEELENAGKIKKAHVQYDVQYELYLMYCKGCGICANECPVQGIKMKLEEK